MANYCATTRSNYFKVKDVDAFKAWAAGRGLSVWENPEEHPNCVGMHADDGDANGWPSQAYDEEVDDFVHVDLAAELARHLAENQVAILMEAGAEKRRYLIGRAVAVHASGGVATIDLCGIYDLAREVFGPEAEITQAEF